MAIDRTWFNNLVDDTGTGTTGTVWNKAAISGLLDAIDALFPALAWTPIDGSGAGLVIANNVAAQYVRIGKLVVAGFNIAYPATANGTAAKLGGLPFPVGPSMGGGVLAYSTFGDFFTVFPLAGSTTVQFWNKAGALAFTNAQMASQTLAGAILYFTP